MLDLVQIAVVDVDTAVADSQPRAIPITAGMVRPARAGAARSDGQHAGSPGEHGTANRRERCDVHVCHGAEEKPR